MTAHTFPNAMAAFATLLLGATVTACGPELQGREASAARDESEPGLQQERSPLEARRVWSGRDFTPYVAAPSPDGRLITDVDWRTGDLAVIDLETAGKRRVTNKGSWSESDSYAESSVFSPDGARIAYVWFDEDTDGFQVRTISVAGEDVRVVFPTNPSVSYVVVEDWAAADRRILVTVFRKDRTSEIGMVDVQTGRYVTLETNDWRAPAVATFSPDGRFVAYDFPVDEGFRQRDVFILSTDGSRKAALVRGPGHERLLGWLPDGEGILFHRQDEEQRGIWKLPVRDGRPAGEAEPVKQDVWQISPLGFAKNAYYYGVAAESRQVHTMAVDLSAGRALGTPEAVGDRSDGPSNDGTWSPDGSKFAYLLDLPGFRHAFLVVESADGERLREMPVFLSQARRLQWTERGLLLYGIDVEGTEGVFRMDPATGELEPQVTVTPGDAGGLGLFEAARDGRTVYFTSPEDEMVAWDLVADERRVIREDVRRVGSVSPDGDWVVFLHGPDDDRRVAVARADGTGSARDVYRLEDARATWGNQGSIPWTPDGRYLLLAEFSRRDRAVDLLRIPVNGGGEPDLLLTSGPQSGARLQVSPDGRRVSFTAGQFKHEIWRLTGLESLTTGGP